MTEAAYKVKPYAWSEPREKCCEAFTNANKRGSIGWVSSKPPHWEITQWLHNGGYGGCARAGGLPIAFCPFCGAPVREES